MKRGFVLGLALGSLFLYFFTSSDVYALSFEQSMDSYSISAIQNNSKLEDKNISVSGKGYLIDGQRAVDNFGYTKDLWKMLPSYRNYYTSVDNNYSLDVYTYHFKKGPALTGSNYDLTFNFAQNYNSSSDSSMVHFENLIVYITSQSGSYVCTGGTVSGVNRKYSCVVPANFDMSIYSITFDFTDISYISEKSIPFAVSYKMIYGETDKEPTPYVPSVVTPDNPNQGVQDAIGNLSGDIMDETPPDLDGLADSAGWLPAGPVDSLINLPLTMLQNLANALGSTCEPVTLTLPFVDEDIQLPCLVSVYNKMGDLPVWLNTIGTIASGFILFGYFLNLYDWVYNRIKMKDNARARDWGGS
jgi:hypothetical protein